MENISYIDEQLANELPDMLVFDLNTPKFADFLVAFADVLTYKYKYSSDADIRAQCMVGASCRTRRLAYNFNTDKYKNGSFIYRDYDGKLLVYSARSCWKGIQLNNSRTNEECIKIVAKNIKQLSYNKFVYDYLIKFANEALVEIEAKFDEMRSQNNGKLVSNRSDNKAEFNKKISIDNANLKFTVGYGSINAERSIYKYAALDVQYVSGANSVNSCHVRYDVYNKCYHGELNEILDKLDLNDDFKNEWNSENKGPSVFSGFTIGEVYNIYCLMANKKNAIKKMSDEVKNEYISSGQGLNPFMLEMFKQLNNELTEKARKLSNELADIKKGLVETVKDARDKAHEEMEKANYKAMEEIDKTIDEYNKMLAETEISLRITKETPHGLHMQGTFF